MQLIQAYSLINNFYQAYEKNLIYNIVINNM